MKIADVLQRIYEAKFLGIKSKKGFYKYKNNKKLAINRELVNCISKTDQTIFNKADIVKRCMFLMINEAARCLEETVVENVESLDMAMIMGAGFPPFQGGLLKYADNFGIDNLVKNMEEFAIKYGKRFTPCGFILKLKRDKSCFYNKIF